MATMIKKFKMVPVTKFEKLETVDIVGLTKRDLQILRAALGTTSSSDYSRILRADKGNAVWRGTEMWNNLKAVIDTLA